jgi:hypothetical protein
MDFIPSTGPHLHILLNHFPSIGAVIALGLFVGSYYVKSEELRRASLVVFALLGLLIIPTYISGAAARWAIQQRPDVAAGIIPVHQDAATLAFACVGFTGLFAWLALWQDRRFGRMAGWNLGAVVVFAVLALIFMTRLGVIGGHINHPELAAEGTIQGVAPGTAPSIETAMINLAWAWPAMECAHYVGMSFILGVVLLMCVRVLGFAKGVSFAALHRLLPLGVFGFLINIISGFYFFISDSGRYVAMAAFPPKIEFMMIGGVSLLYFTIFKGPWSTDAEGEAPVTAKFMAVVTILSWALVIAFGRLLPYYGGGG